MAANRYTKDPDALLDYGHDWAPWLGADTIGTATWTVPAGLTKEAESHTTTTATVWVSGGTVGATYQVTCHITTAGGREDDRSLFLYVQER